jgi:nitrate reductase NapA
MEIDRREFVKTAAMAAATGVAASLVSGGSRTASAADVALPQLPARPAIPNVNWHKAPCRFCGTGCHVQVGVRDGHVVAIAGDQQADVNKGLLCVKAGLLQSAV